MSKVKKTPGTVALVGGGSGDPSLLVVRAAELLAGADQGDLAGGAGDLLGRAHAGPPAGE